MKKLFLMIVLLLLLSACGFLTETPSDTFT